MHEANQPAQERLLKVLPDQPWLYDTETGDILHINKDGQLIDAILSVDRPIEEID